MDPTLSERLCAAAEALISMSGQPDNRTLVYLAKNDPARLRYLVDILQIQADLFHNNWTNELQDIKARLEKL